ncbi:MAG: RpiB/LacA/LacB family sugar-phosphate isomerase [Candidatus Taylorbacteria bacterium]
MKNQTIILAADHAGFKLKEVIKSFLEKNGYSILDVGAHELIEGDDYPVYMTAAAMKVAEDIKGETKAIMFGGSGQGEAIVANRFPGVRAIVWYGDTVETNTTNDVIRLSREHNNANILSIGARFVTDEDAKKVIGKWLETPFSGQDSHQRRIRQIDEIE